MSFDAEVAGAYDNHPRGDESEAVDFLAQAAGDGPALELAVGTGRIALPLAARGVRVDGIDISPDMLAQLRTRPRAEEISLTLGDFAEVPVDGTYRLIYIVFNTLFNLLTQEHQLRCFENVAAHLTEDGCFVVEGIVPNSYYRLREGQYADAEDVEVDSVKLDVGRYDPVTQLLEKNHVSLSRDGIRLNPVVLRFAWPSELDLMARAAGLRLRERWDDWRRTPFTSTRNCVSVYGR